MAPRGSRGLTLRIRYPTTGWPRQARPASRPIPAPGRTQAASSEVRRAPPSLCGRSHRERPLLADLRPFASHLRPGPPSSSPSRPRVETPAASIFSPRPAAFRLLAAFGPRHPGPFHPLVPRLQRPEIQPGNPTAITRPRLPRVSHHSAAGGTLPYEAARAAAERMDRSPLLAKNRRRLECRMSTASVAPRETYVCGARWVCGATDTAANSCHRYSGHLILPIRWPSHSFAASVAPRDRRGVGLSPCAARAGR